MSTKSLLKVSAVAVHHCMMSRTDRLTLTHAHSSREWERECVYIVKLDSMWRSREAHAHMFFTVKTACDNIWKLWKDDPIIVLFLDARANFVRIIGPCVLQVAVGACVMRVQ